MFSIIALLMVSLVAAPQASPAHALDKLGWLAGSWRLEQKGKVIEEQWTAPGGGTMLGVSRTVANGKTVAFEFLRIEQRGEDVFYIAQPQGRPPTEFRLASSEGGAWVFENPQHDFPKKIHYQRSADGSLTASIEGDGGRRIEFRYSRVK